MTFTSELVSAEGQQTPSNESTSDASVSNINRPRATSRGPARPAETPAKRLACNPCRGRKVRCDRQQPTCGRCARVGDQCVYSGPSKQSVSKLDLSRLLLTLHDRLGGLHSTFSSYQSIATLIYIAVEQTEARLAFGTPMLDTNQYSIPWPDLGMLPTPPNTEVMSEVPEFTSLQPSHVQELLSNQGEPSVASNVAMPLDMSEG